MLAEEKQTNMFIDTSAEMLVAMVMASQHVITLWCKNSNVGALCVLERLKQNCEELLFSLQLLQRSDGTKTSHQ